MKNYYEILNIDVNSSYEDIQYTYNEKIKQFTGLPFLTNEMKTIIKNLKEAKYVLLDEERRNRYNNLLQPIEEIIEEEPVIEEQVIEEQVIEEQVIEEQVTEEQVTEEQYNAIPQYNQRTLPKLKEKKYINNTQVCDRIFSINFPLKPQ